MSYGLRAGRALGLALLFALPGAGAAQQPAGLPLQAEAEAIVRKVGGKWGAVAWSIDAKQPLFEINPDDVLIPASNNKVFSSIWALDVLGPDYRFPTDLLVTGEIGADGTLSGDVVLRGSGDPAFGNPAFTREPMTPLRIMAQRLKERGVRVVRGDVVGDGSAFDTLYVGPRWPRDTGGGSAAYAPPVSGLSFQRNLLWIQVIPGGRGPAQIRLDPAVQEIPVVSTVRSGGGRAWAVRRAGSDTIEVKGSVGGRGIYRYGVGVSNPPLLAAGALKAALLEAGIQVAGQARVGETPQGARLLHRHYSIPLAQMVPKLNTESDNFFAEHFWKAAARKVVGQGSYALGGTASALHFIRHADVAAGQLFQADGSGLSEYNRTSANALMRALLYANERPWAQLFHHSMAVAAEPPGTLRNMYRGTVAAGNLHAKTGYIRGVRTLSGYVRAANGELLAFSLLYNGNGTSAARGVDQELGVLLANYGRPAPAPTPAAAPKSRSRSRSGR